MRNQISPACDSARLRSLLRASAAAGILIFAASAVEARNVLLLAAGGGGGAGCCDSTPGGRAFIQGKGSPGQGNGGANPGPAGQGAPGGSSNEGLNGGGGAGWFSNGGGGGGNSAGGGGGSFIDPSNIWAYGSSYGRGWNNAHQGGLNGSIGINNGLGKISIYLSGVQFTYVLRTSGVVGLYAEGGQGGGGYAAGGYGAILSEGVNLRAGDVLHFVVGGGGAAASDGSAGGGGGGSFIWLTSAAPEPVSWLTMEIGVLGIGFALRQVRRRLAATC